MRQNFQIWPVIHVKEKDQNLAKYNAGLAYEAGCSGVLLISMERADEELCELAKAIRSQYRGKFLIGVNHLTINPLESLQKNIQHGLDATWTDSPGFNSKEILNSYPSQIQKTLENNPKHIFFGSIAFKYQTEEKDPVAAALMAWEFRMIPTTSGPGTGEPAPLKKLKLIREGIGDVPLAVASGITPENVKEQTPFLTHALVATGISKDEYRFDPVKLRSLMKNLKANDVSTALTT